MKISARTCTHEKVKALEPELEFYLHEGSNGFVELKVWDKANNVTASGVVLRINRTTGKLHRIQGINKAFGLPLDGMGRLMLSDGMGRLMLSTEL